MSSAVYLKNKKLDLIKLKQAFLAGFPLFSTMVISKNSISEFDRHIIDMRWDKQIL